MYNTNDTSKFEKLPIQLFSSEETAIKSFLITEKKEAYEAGRREVLEEVEKWADENMADGDWTYERLLLFIKTLKWKKFLEET